MIAAPSPPVFFRRLAGLCACFCGFLFRWILHLVFHLIRGVALHETSSCSRGDSLGDCGRHAIPDLAFFSLLCGLLQPISSGAGNSCRRRMLTSHVFLHSCLTMPHALQLCRRITSYTSYLRTNDCTNNGYVIDNLEHNTMINIDTVAHMILHYTQS